MSYQIFVSYRRDGGEALACFISERLKQQGYTVFYDVESLRSGKFNEEILRVIDECTDVIVVLPPNALDRCKNDDDWVRREISHAIRANKKIIPIMMRGFEFPPELPADIDDLRNYNGVSANMEYFDAAFTKLMSMLNSSAYSIADKVNQLTRDETLRSELTECFDKVRSEGTAENKLKLAECCKKLKNDSLNEEIVGIYQQVARFGNAVAQNELGKCYHNGMGVEKSIEKAFEYYKLAADQGLSEAQYNLARCFEKHYKRLMFNWMKKASEQSHVDALYYVGRCYELGLGVDENHKKAYEYYFEAYKNGHLGATYSMGECYEYGIGVDKDYTAAKEFYKEAKEKGHRSARKKTTARYWIFKPLRRIFIAIFSE